MPHKVAIVTAQNVKIEYEVANLGDRILAFIIDRLIMVAYALLVILMMIPQFSNNNFPFIFLVGGLLSIPLFFYSLIFEMYNDGQTPGKKAMNIKVAALDGGQVTTSMYFLRWLMRIVDVNMMSGIIAIIAIATSEKGQRIGDMVANTTVISLKKKAEIKETSYETLDLEYHPYYHSVLKLNNNDISTIKEVLANNSEDSFTLKIELAKKLEEVLNIEKQGSSEDFLRTVVRDYNYYQQYDKDSY